jgi:dihydroxyacetone kinase-like predicted kinase
MGAFVVDGGETFNPSIYDLLAAIHEVPSEEVVVLPNNPNVLMAAERAAGLSDKEARVVPCTAQQAGLVALLVMDTSASVEDNAAALTESVEGLRIGSVAPAARDDAQGRFSAGDAVGFVSEEIVAWGGAQDVLSQTLVRLCDGAEIVTVVCGADPPIPDDQIPSHAPDGSEVEVHRGGQPHYWWLFAAE